VTCRQYLNNTLIETTELVATRSAISADAWSIAPCGRTFPARETPSRDALMGRKAVTHDKPTDRRMDEIRTHTA